MQIIGIDLGTTGICGVSIDAESGELLDSVTVNSQAFIHSEEPWEKIQSPQKIISIAQDILNKLISDNTVSIGVTGQMHGIVYVDNNGNAVSPLYTWQDERGNLPYKTTTYAKHLGSFTGYGNVTDFYNRENNIRPQNAITYCTVHDYLVMKLTGIDKPLMHSSNAASFGLYDIKNNTFDYDIDNSITSDFEIAGTYRGIPVGVAIGDNQASVFSTLTDENNILINIGTGSQISIISNDPINGTDLETRPYFDGKFLIVGAALCGGRAYSLLNKFYYNILNTVSDVSEEKVYEIMNSMLCGSDTSSIRVDTRFAGTRSQPEVKGSICDITTDNFTPRNLTLGVLQGMLEELKNMFLQMNTSKSGLVGSGNGLRKNINLIKLAEKEFNSRLMIPKHTEEAAFGAALFGAVAANVFCDTKQAQSIVKYFYQVQQ